MGKKVCGNNLEFLNAEITSKKVRENNVDFFISKNTSKRYMKTTWNFVKILFSTHRRNIDFQSTSTQLVRPLGAHAETLQFWNPGISRTFPY